MPRQGYPSPVASVLPKRSRRVLLMAAVAGMLLAICLIFTAVMRDAYRDIGRTTALSASNLATSVADDVDRNVELLDLSLQSIVRLWTDPAVQQLRPELRNAVLFDTPARARDFGAMLVLDEKGLARVSSMPGPVPSISFADRDYFLVHRGSANIGLFVSQPFVSRISKAWTIGLSRRINNADGSFGGVVIGVLKLSYIDEIYKGVDLGPDGVAALLRIDGTIMARTPFVEGDIRRNVRNTDVFGSIRDMRNGAIEAQSALDGKRRIIAFHRVGDLPLAQVVEFSGEGAYADWRQKAKVLGSLLLGLCVASLTLLFALERELRRRIKAEAELERMARTDALTTLANRRHFEEAMASEWGRAVRSNLYLSLLIVDADHFKGYNDTSGHLAGDEVLRQIADCIRDSVHRPGDLACRIGGEEFAVLLPETDEAGATAVAETIRAAVRTLGQPHPASPAAVVTVSIGVASVLPRRTQSSDSLVGAADAALYLAKKHGRDCVRTAPVPKHVSLVA